MLTAEFAEKAKIKQNTGSRNIKRLAKNRNSELETKSRRNGSKMLKVAKRHQLSQDPAWKSR